MEEEIVHSWAVIHTIPNGAFNAQGNYAWTVNTPTELSYANIQWIRLRSYDAWGNNYGSPGVFPSRIFLNTSIPTLDTEITKQGSIQSYCSFFAVNSFATAMIIPMTRWLPVRGEHISTTLNFEINTELLPSKGTPSAVDLNVMFQFEWSTSRVKPFEL